jgi:heme/copper-type cytochrome/quinol oxidase subunit 4
MNLAKIYRFTTLALLIGGGSSLINYLGWAIDKLTPMALLANVAVFVVFLMVITFNYLNRKEDKNWRTKALSNILILVFLIIGGIIQWI